MRKASFFFSRRGVTLGLTTLLLLCVTACKRGSTDSAAPKTLLVGSWGGAYQEAQRNAFFLPFEKETGVKIIEGSTPDYGKFYEWQRAGSASLDVVDVETYFAYEAGRKGALQTIDYTVVPKADLMPAAVSEYGVASCAYADVLAWNSRLHPDWKDITWQEFWDTRRYPGARGLRDLPASTFEAALLSTGLSPEKLYPLDVQRAIDRLGDLRKNTRVALWSGGSQPIEWLLSGSVTISSAWNGRVYDAQKNGQPVSMTFDHGMIDWLWWVVPKDSAKRDLAMRFIAFTLRPDRQAALARNIPYGPTNLEALKQLDATTLAALPTAPENLRRLTVRDNRWWADNAERIQPLWREWKLGLK
jgi:putative spermidine/putrescine transport system substrate-binding protein